MSKFWSPLVKTLSPYVPGEQPSIDNLLKLNTNENPYGPSPLVIEAIKQASMNGLERYPQPESETLSQAIADFNNVNIKNIFTGNGSDEILAHIFMAFFKGKKKILFPDITYSFYPVYCKLFGIEYETIPLDKNFEIIIDDYNKDNGGIIFANPNAPTSVNLSLQKIVQLLTKNTEQVVVIDEAYVDFGADSAVSLIEQFPNLCVVQTVSKSRSLAGLRVGYAIANEQLIDGLKRVKNSFNSYPVDRLASAGAIAAFKDVKYFESTLQKVISTRDILTTKLEKLGFSVLKSATNFLFATHCSLDAPFISSKLRKQGIIVRHFNSPKIDNYLRITVGTDSDSARLLEAIESIVSS